MSGDLQVFYDLLDLFSRYVFAAFQFHYNRVLNKKIKVVSPDYLVTVFNRYVNLFFPMQSGFGECFPENPLVGALPVVGAEIVKNVIRSPDDSVTQVWVKKTYLVSCHIQSQMSTFAYLQRLEFVLPVFRFLHQPRAGLRQPWLARPGT